MVPDLRRADRGGIGPQLVHLATPGSSAGSPGGCVVAAAAGPLPDWLDPAGRSDRLGGPELRAVVCVLPPDVVWPGPLPRGPAALPRPRRNSAPLVATAAGPEKRT